MGFIKWVIVFIISFAIAFIIIVNFSKPEFGVLVPAWIFFYQTQPHPVWVYVSGALGLGLLAGLSVAVYYYVTLRAAIFKKDRQINKLESERGMAAAPPDQAEEQIEPADGDSF